MTQPSSAPVVATVANGFTTIALNRPDSLNALNVPMLTAFVHALEQHKDTGPLIVTGNGRAFCVGEDLKQTLAPKTGAAPELREAFEMLQDITRLMTSNPAPIIAAVSGFAIGGGAEIALAADFVILSPETRIRFPEVPIGHAHTGGISLRLPLLVGLMRAKELLLTGRWVGAEEAVHIGLATEVADDPVERADELAAQLAAQPRRSMAAAKRALELSTFPQQEATLQLEVEAALYCFAAPEAAATFEQFSANKTVAGAR
jgi:enoyl-CoA hydratase/carnithine racemase